MLVVRPSRALLGRVAVKVVSAGAFEVVVVDYDAIPGTIGEGTSQGWERGAGGKRKAWAPEVLVRKLALASESNRATVLLLTDATRPRAVPWPVALRLELTRPSRDELSVRVAKDRRGRIGVAKTIPFRPTTRCAG
jgi:recombination protein RecA